MTAATGLAPLLFADGRLPAGGHAHSAGLEPAVAAGLTAEGIPGYLRARLDALGRIEAAATVLSHRRARATTGRATGSGPAAADPLPVIEGELLARSASLPMREASGRLGRGLARLVGLLWPGDPAARELRAVGVAPQRPVALGVATALGGAGERDAARVCLYDDAQAVASAALKLLPVDPVETVRWVMDLAGAVELIVEEAVAVVDAASLPASVPPQIEQWALAHHLSRRRIFSA